MSNFYFLVSSEVSEVYKPHSTCFQWNNRGLADWDFVWRFHQLRWEYRPKLVNNVSKTFFLCIREHDLCRFHNLLRAGMMYELTRRQLAMWVEILWDLCLAKILFRLFHNEDSTSREWWWKFISFHRADVSDLSFRLYESVNARVNRV